MEHPIGSLMDTTMEKIKEMIDVNTIIGEPITSPDGTLIIPVSKVSYGFATGGSDLPTKKENKDCFSLVIDLKAHPKRYVHFSVFGRKDK